jgi:hypothetical protein
MKQIKFTLPKEATKKAKNGIQAVGGKYNFKDGELVVNEDVARKIKKVLTTYYGCAVSAAGETAAEPEPQSGDDASLSKTATKK